MEIIMHKFKKIHARKILFGLFHHVFLSLEDSRLTVQSLHFFLNRFTRELFYILFIMNPDIGSQIFLRFFARYSCCEEHLQRPRSLYLHLIFAYVIAICMVVPRPPS